MEGVWKYGRMEVDVFGFRLESKSCQPYPLPLRYVHVMQLRVACLTRAALGAHSLRRLPVARIASCASQPSFPGRWRQAWTQHLALAGLEASALSERHRRLRELFVTLELAQRNDCADYTGDEGVSTMSAFVSQRLREDLAASALSEDFLRYSWLSATQRRAAVTDALSRVEGLLTAAPPRVNQWQLSARRHAQSCAASGTMPLLTELLAEPGWRAALEEALSGTQARELQAFVHSQWAEDERGGAAIYPPRHLLFDAFNACPLSATRVVVVGQDPYHRAGQACGLAFSLPPCSPLPRPSSLRNILRELQSDVGVPTPSSGGDLSPWAHQGVLLLNTVLTVRAGEPASHAKQGWEHVTDAALTCCAKSAVDRGDSIVAMLWGAHARAKAPLLLKDEGHTLVLQAAHPSGLSANRGFFGCGHFSAANAHLVAKGGAAINWRVGDGVPQTLQGD